jgi:hypothetical protein
MATIFLTITKQNYSKVIGSAAGKGVCISRRVSIKISRHAMAVQTIAPTAIGQKSFGVPNIATGAITNVIIILQSQKCNTNLSSKLAKLCDAISKKMTLTPNS